MAKSLNLIYASSNISFLNKIKMINAIVFKYKSEGVINHFGPADEKEVSRGESYAVFPELAQGFKEGQEITIAALREGLRSRGVIDEVMQNKAMTMLLQCKAGIHFAMGTILNDILLTNGHQLLMSNEYDVKLEVKGPDHIKLVFTGVWQNFLKVPKVDCLAAKVEIDITPKRIAIYNFDITQLNNSSEAVNAFKFLQNNQKSIWQKIIIFFKTYFNTNTDLEVENSSVDKVKWKDNTNTAPIPS